MADGASWPASRTRNFGKGTTSVLCEVVRGRCDFAATVDAVFQLGSSAVETYLTRYGWQRTWPFNDNFKGSVPHDYKRLWQANCPMYTKGIVAVCGGWHFPWPDGDFTELLNSQLVLWTFKNAEPWIEVYFDGEGFSVKERIT
jgi:hypothetical protein